MDWREAIQLTAGEQFDFLEHSRMITLSTIDPNGFPHTVAMWFIVHDGCVHMTTYAKSQKVINLQRNPKVALMAESGTTYETLKGVMIRGHAEVINDPDLCVTVITHINNKMLGRVAEGVDEVIRVQAKKRVVIKVAPERVSSWDHRKLGGVY